LAKDQITAIDIGTNSVKVLELELTQSEINIVNSGVASYPRQSTAEKVPDEAVVDVLIQLIQSKGFRTKPVAISVPRHAVTVKTLADLPASAKAEDIEKMVPIQVESELPFDIADAVYRYYNVQRAPEGVSLEVVATKKASVERYIDIAERLGLKLQCIIPSAFATYGVIFDQFKDQLAGQTLAVVDIGAGVADFCIIQHGRLAFSRSFAFGGNNLTQAFEGEYGISFQEAEERKMAEADLRSTDGSKLAGPWAENLTTQIVRSLRAFTGQGETNGTDALWLCGGGSLLPGLQDYLSDKLGIKVDLWNPLSKMKDESLSENEQMRFSVALGIGIIGVAGEERTPTVNANLLPKEITEREERARLKIRTFAIAALAVLILAAASIGFAGWRRSQAAQYESLVQKLATLERKEEIRSAKAALENSILMHQIATPYLTPLEILREMSAKLPDRRKMALTNLSIDKKGKLSMNVEANSHADVSDVIRILNETKLQDKVKLFNSVRHGAISKVSKEKRPVFQVQIVCELNNKATQEIE
jgi:type IV pilus assembly protein PilM